MTNERAAEVLNAIIFMLGREYDTDEVEEAIHMAIEALQAQESCNDFATNLQPCKQDADDLISRQAAKEQKAEESLLRTDDKSVSKDDVIYRQAVLDWLKNEWNGMVTSLFDGIKALPSAQPEKRTNERTETHSCDCISRQAAIDALFELYEYQRDIDPTEAADLVRQGIFLAEKKIEQLPSAEPEVTEEAVKEYCRKRCLCIVDSALLKKYESAQLEIISEWWEKQKDSAQGQCELIKMYPTGAWYCCNAQRRITDGDTISRQDAITAIQKAYADTESGTDKCAVWKNVGLTNALHIMQDLPSTQPEIIRCKDCKHWDGVDTCDVIDAPVWDNDFCSMAERRSDE